MFIKAINKIILILVVFSFFKCGIISYSYKSRIEGNYIPRNLNEAIYEIDKKVSDSTKNSIKQMSENDFATESHFGTGKGIRNDWNLWRKSRLARYFNKKGIYHPDDMSSIILRSYYRKTTKKEINLNEQIVFYKKYWEGVGVTKLPEKTKYPEANLEFRYAISYGRYTKDKKWATVYIQTNSLNNSHWIYDYYYDWKKIDDSTKILLEKTSVEETEALMNKIFNK